MTKSNAVAPKSEKAVVVKKDLPITAIINLLDAAKLVAVASAKIGADRKVTFADVPHVLDLCKEYNSILSAVKDMDQFIPEAKDLDQAESIQIIAKAFEIVKAVKAALEAAKAS